MCACIQFYLYLKIYVCTHISFCSGVDVTQARQLWHMDCTVDLSYLVHSCVIFQFFIFSVFHFFLHFIYMPAHRHTYGHLYIAHMYTDVMYIYIFQKHSLFLYCHNAPLAITKRRKLSYSGQQGKIELESISVQLRKEKNVFLQLHCSYRNPYYLPKGNEDELN